MNLGQIATAVGQRLGVDTSNSSTRDGAAVRSFLTIRHDQLYRAFLWKDSIIEFTLPINPATAYVPTANYMPTKGRVILPPIFQSVVAARFGFRSLKVERPMLFYRAHYYDFLNTGNVCEFELLSACVWEFDVTQNLILAIANAADAGQSVVMDTLQPDGVSVLRSNVNLVYNGLTSNLSSDRVDSLIKPVTQGTVALDFLAPPLFTAFPGLAEATIISSTSITQTPQFYAYSNTGYDANFVAGQTVRLIGFGLAPSPPPTQIPLQLTLTITSIATVGGMFGFYAVPQVVNNTYPIPPLSNGDLYFTNETLSTGASIYIGSNFLTKYPVITLQATDLFAPKCQRIQLIAKPTTNNQTGNNNLSVLGKRTTPPFSADSDVPGINGLDGVLFALAYYDFKQRDEAGGTGDTAAALNEAVGPRFLTQGVPGGFLGKLIEEEVIQAAYNCRIIPSTGFGGHDDFNGPAGSKSDIYGNP